MDTSDMSLPRSKSTFQNLDLTAFISRKKSPDGNSRIWIGFRNDKDASYNGRMTFRQVLAQEETNLAQSSQAKLGTRRTTWFEAFPGVSTKANLHILEQLQRGDCAFKQAYCQNSACLKRCEPLQMEWISITFTAPGSTTGKQEFIVEYIFTLHGYEMIAICSNYYFALYHFQRQDGSVSTVMTLNTALNPKQNKSRSSEAPADRSAAVLHDNKSCRQSRRLHAPSSLKDKDSATGSLDEETSATSIPPEGLLATSHDDAHQSTPAASPAASTSHDVDTIEDDTQIAGEEEVDEATHNSDFFKPGSTAQEYEAIIVQITYTYGIRVLTAPNIVAYTEMLSRAVREDDRLALCQAFGKLHTILVKSANNAADFLDEEYEEMVSRTVLDYGMEVLSTAEGTTFMDMIGRAMVEGDREGLCKAYAALRACMAVYGRHV